MSHLFRLVPEWAPQEAVLLTWPDCKTDWLPWLDDVQNVYLQIIYQLNQAKTAVILLAREHEHKPIKDRLHESAQVLLIAADYNDTWIRDYGFLTCSDGQSVKPIEFTFNGWGQKFDAHKDNLINQQVLADLCQKPIQAIDFVLEGGALEIDHAGQILTTQLCLANPKRNGTKTIESYQQDFARYLGTLKTIVLQNGHLEGDDTDGHIDTLVRFTPQRGLVIQSAFNRPSDPHFASLAALVDECKNEFPESMVYELPLPLIFNAEDERLPASYANFLISNQHILAPIYQQPEDSLAIEVIQRAYPDFKVVPINCLALIQQFGSLHCISMQVPCGILRPAVLQSISNGVQSYGE